MCVDQRRHARQQPLARRVAPGRGRQAVPRRCGAAVALRRDVANEPLVRMMPPSEPSKIWVGLHGLTAITCWSGWIPLGAFYAVRCRSRPRRRTRAMADRGVVGEVGERAVQAAVPAAARPDHRPCRVDHGAAVRAAVAAADAVRVTRLLAVLVRADHVDRVGQARRRVDVLVVPALAGAEVDRGVVRARRRVRRSASASRCTSPGTDSRPGGAVAPAAWDASSVAAGWLALSVPPEVRGSGPGAACRALGQVDARLPVLDGRREHQAVGAGEGTARHRGRVELRRHELRLEDLLERRRCAHRRHAARALVERRGVDDVGVQRVEPDVGDAERAQASLPSQTIVNVWPPSDDS